MRKSVTCCYKIVLFFGLFFCLFSCGNQQESAASDFEQQKEQLDSSEWIALGAHVFSSKLISPKRISCASCHKPEKAFQDGYEVAIIHNKRLIRNTPSLLNLSRYHTFFWDGRAASLSEQLEGPLFARSEMDSSPKYLAVFIEQDPILRPVFEEMQLSGQQHATEFVKYALEKFLISNCTQETKYDTYIAGQTLFSEQEKKGLALFSGKAGCVKCHVPPHFTDNQFHDIGLPRRNTIFESYTQDGRDAFRLGPDFGRGNIAAGKENLFRFRTPSLLNVARTAPYMHDGTFRELEEVVDFYARTDSVLLQNPLDRSEKQDLIAFLHTLNDTRED